MYNMVDFRYTNTRWL